MVMGLRGMGFTQVCRVEHWCPGALITVSTPNGGYALGTLPCTLSASAHFVLTDTP